MRQISLAKQIENRITELGGKRFIESYQPSWEKWLQNKGLTIDHKNNRVPTYMAIKEIKSSTINITKSHIHFIFSALVKILNKTLSDNDLKNSFFDCLLPQEIELCDLGRLPNLSHVAGRIDGVLNPHKISPKNSIEIPKIIEFNTNTAEGRIYHHVLMEGMVRLLNDLELEAPKQLTALSSSALWQAWQWLLQQYQTLPQTINTPTIAIVYEKGYAEKEAEIAPTAEYLKQWSTPLGINVITGDYRDIDQSQDGVWFLDGTPFQIVWRNAGPGNEGILETPFAKLLTQPPIHTFVGSDIVGRLLGIKSLLAQLWNPENDHLFTTNEKNAIRLFVPWAAIIKDGKGVLPSGKHTKDIIQWIATHKDELVIKPQRGSYGQDVTIGVQSSPSQWDKALSQAIHGHCIVMNYCQIPQIRLAEADPLNQWKVTMKNCFFDCNFYFQGKNQETLIPWSRTSDSRITNLGIERDDGTPNGGVILSMEEISPPMQK